MATVPLSGTNIRLLRNVPFSNDYKHTRWFDTKTEQTNYFLNKPVVHTMTQANFQRIEGKHFIAVNKSIDELWGTNYLMFQNAEYNDKWFYAFVTKLEYKQRNNTYVHFQIDVLQTWRFEMNFKPSFVVREHRPLWNSDGTPVINTIDEGLNYGLEYDNVYTYHHVENNGYMFLVIVTKEPIEYGREKEVEGGLIGTSQPLSYYVVPFKLNDTTPTVVVKGEDYPVTPPLRILQEIYKLESAVNNIVSLYITDYIGVDTTVNVASGSNSPDVMIFPDNNNSDFSVVTVDGDSSLYLIKVNKQTSFSAKEKVINEDKYEGFREVKESKLLMYPYTVTILDDFRGNRVEIKNEYIENDKLVMVTRGSLGTSNFVSYAVKDYNINGSTFATRIINENAVINSTPSDIPIINDLLTAFLQGNKNSIQNQKNSVMFNGVMNGIGATISGVASGVSGNAVGVAGAGTSVVQGAGNTVLQLQAIEAKQQDIGNVPPQIAKMGSNIAYDMGNGFRGVYVIKKQIKPEYQRLLEDFFNMYGYKTNEVKIPNFHTRKYWNYVQTSSCVITGNFNNEDLQELKNIFDNGITLWHTDDIGNYDLNNEVL